MGAESSTLKSVATSSLMVRLAAELRRRVHGSVVGACTDRAWLATHPPLLFVGASASARVRSHAYSTVFRRSVSRRRRLRRANGSHAKLCGQWPTCRSRSGAAVAGEELFATTAELQPP